MSLPIGTILGFQASFRAPSPQVGQKFPALWEFLGRSRSKVIPEDGTTQILPEFMEKLPLEGLRIHGERDPNLLLAQGQHSQFSRRIFHGKSDPSMNIPGFPRTASSEP